MAKRTRADVLALAAKFVKKNGANFTQRGLMQATGIKPGTVAYFFGGMDGLRKELGVTMEPAELLENARASLAAERARAKTTAERKVLKDELAEATKQIGRASCRERV